MDPAEVTSLFTALRGFYLNELNLDGTTLNMKFSLYSLNGSAPREVPADQFVIMVAGNCTDWYYKLWNSAVKNTSSAEINRLQLKSIGNVMNTNNVWKFYFCLDHYDNFESLIVVSAQSIILYDANMDLLTSEKITDLVLERQTQNE